MTDTKNKGSRSFFVPAAGREQVDTHTLTPRLPVTTRDVAHDCGVMREARKKTGRAAPGGYPVMPEVIS